jgi:hypothetical protein
MRKQADSEKLNSPAGVNFSLPRHCEEGVSARRGNPVNSTLLTGLLRRKLLAMTR